MFPYFAHEYATQISDIIEFIQLRAKQTARLLPYDVKPPRSLLRPFK